MTDCCSSSLGTGDCQMETRTIECLGHLETSNMGCLDVLLLGNWIWWYSEASVLCFFWLFCKKRGFYLNLTNTKCTFYISYIAYCFCLWLMWSLKVLCFEIIGIEGGGENLWSSKYLWMHWLLQFLFNFIASLMMMASFPFLVKITNSDLIYAFCTLYKMPKVHCTTIR